MPQPRLLERLVKALEAAGIDYMITGSIASSVYGEPRSTHDIDVVVDLTYENVVMLAQAFPEPDFFLDLESARDAVATGSMFNLIAVTEGDKVDFWPLSAQSYDRSRFGRKSEEHFLDVTVKLCSAEDIIISKLQWSALSGGSEKQFGDALHVYEVQRNHLDLAYIERWIETLQLGDLWTRLKHQAELD